VVLETIQSISVTPQQVLGAPRIGRDLQADDWYRDQRRAQGWNERRVAEGLFLMRGYYVVDLAPPCDGLSDYSNGQAFGPVERYSFRAELLNDLEHILGTELVEAAYHSKHADELVEFGQRLLDCADRFARQMRIDPSRRPAGQFHAESPLWQHDIIRSAGRWALYWGSRGHGLHAVW
jgi:hypothetical protein